VKRISQDERERLTVQVSSREPVAGVATLLAHLG
jgi:hypothetical protein